MLIMLSNYSGLWPGYLAGKYPGKIGHLYSPGGQRGPWPFIPYALDNGRYPAFFHGKSWDKNEFDKLVSWGHTNKAKQSPLWVAVPDSPTNRDETLNEWARHAPRLKELGCRLAMVVQDGMTPSDVPDDADVVFVGGSTEWKWATVSMWCKHFARVHVGRVNSPARLYECEALGVESVDGTGWLRGGPDSPQFLGLLSYLENGNKPMRVFVAADMFSEFLPATLDRAEAQET